MTKSPRDGFSEEQLKAVLARAVELDSRKMMITAEDIRAIGAEVGISHESLEAALREHLAVHEPQISTGSRRESPVILAFGVPIGVAAGALLSTGKAWAVLGALGTVAGGLVASGALIVRQGRHASLRSFHAKNFVLWAGVTAGSIASIGLLDPEGIGTLAGLGWCLRSWVASSILGSAAVIAIRRVTRTDDLSGGNDMIETPAVTRRTRWLSAIRRAVEWVSQTFRQGAAVQLHRRDAGSPDTRVAIG